MVLTMKKKFILGTALVLAVGALAACSTAYAGISEAPVFETVYIPTPAAVSYEYTYEYEYVYEYEHESTEVVTHIQLSQLLLDELAEKSEDEQIAFWEDLRQNYPDVYTIEVYDENGEVTWSLVTQSANDIVDPIHIYDLDEAMALHRADGVTTPTYLPEGFVFERAWFSSFSCPILNPDAEFAGGQLFVVFGDGEQNLTLEVRYHPEEGGFDVWTACENLEELVINGRNAIVGEGGLSVQVGHNVRYSFMTWAFAGSEGSAICNDELIMIAESIALAR